MDFFLFFLELFALLLKKLHKALIAFQEWKWIQAPRGEESKDWKKESGKQNGEQTCVGRFNFPFSGGLFKRLSRELVRECFIFVYCRKPFLAREKEETFASVPGMHLPTFCHVLDSTWDVLRAHVYDKGRLGWCFSGGSSEGDIVYPGAVAKIMGVSPGRSRGDWKGKFLTLSRGTNTD